ncbi:malonate decarboxylase holo-ACP synthase [Kitasatospora azatica]|uniref:malonate decarboxylase holo-ACP synthase n=1 Tax=Kitasatospora azatica TaxID=58347 RepID=UPI00068D05F1|nr:malonate decarboxylase holo-ACP synthase [Kitasatospora azatica]
MSTTAARPGQRSTHDPAPAARLPRARVVGPVTATRSLTPTAHDLLLLHHLSALRHTPGHHGQQPSLPAWAHDHLRARPWVAVSRSPILVGRSTTPTQPGRRTPNTVPASEQWIPVTIHGPQRHQELSAFAPRSTIARVMRPEDLLHRLGLLPATRTTRIPALHVLPSVDEIMTRQGLSWGPTGEVAYELASGAPVTRPTSHLQVLLRAPQPLGRNETAQLRQCLRQLPAQIDAEFETRHGAASLTEYAASTRILTLHTENGPRTVTDPWHPDIRAQ